LSSQQKATVVRVCDGCFNVVKADNAIPGARKKRKPQRKPTQENSDIQGRSMSVSSDSSILLGHNNKRATDKESKVGSRTQRGIGEVQNQLNQTKLQLNDRGNHLSELAEKSEQMVDASEKFKQMCERINDKHKGNSNWGFW